MKLKFFIYVILMFLFLVGALNSTVSVETLTLAKTLNTILASLAFVAMVFFGVKMRKKGTIWSEKVFIAILLILPFAAMAQMVQDTLSIGDYVFAGMSIQKLWAAYIVAGLALFLRWTWTASKAVKNNHRTKNKYSWGFWFRDNLLTKILSLTSNSISLYFIFRFSGEFLGMAFSMALAATVGLSLDYFIDKLKKMQPDIAINREERKNIM